MTYEQLRNRAQDCMNLAKSARSEVDAAMLEEIADELLEAAKRVRSERVSQAPRQS